MGYDPTTRKPKAARNRDLSPRVESLEGRQLLTVSFTNQNHPTVIASEHQPFYAIGLDRFSADPNATENVRLTTSDGTAKAGVDYTAIDQVVTFGPGETHKSIPLPIVNDGKPEGDETVNLTLASETNDPAFPKKMVLTIVDRQDVTPPTVTGRRLITRGQAVTGIALTFSEPMDPATVQNPGNYVLSRQRSLSLNGATGFFNDRVRTAIKSAAYDPSTRTVTLTPKKPLRPSTEYTLDTFDPYSDAKLSPPTDAAGNALDGYGDGVPDGMYSMTFARGRTIRFQLSGAMANATGVATVRLTGGTMESVGDSSLPPVSFDALNYARLRLIGTRAGRSVLSGGVVGSDGKPQRATDPALALAISSPTPFVNRLRNPPFATQVTIG